VVYFPTSPKQCFCTNTCAARWLTASL